MVVGNQAHFAVATIRLNLVGITGMLSHLVTVVPPHSPLSARKMRRCVGTQTCEGGQHMFRSWQVSEELFPHLGRGFLVCFLDSADLLLAIARSSPPVAHTSRRARCPSAVAQLVLHPSPAGTLTLTAALITQIGLFGIFPPHTGFLIEPPKHPPRIPADSLLSAPVTQGKHISARTTAVWHGCRSPFCASDRAKTCDIPFYHIDSRALGGTSFTS